MLKSRWRMQRHGEDTCLRKGGRDCPATLHNASSNGGIDIGWLYHVSPPLMTWPPLLWTLLCPSLAHTATVSPTASEERECWAHSNGVKEVQLFPESFINLPLQGTCRILIPSFVPSHTCFAYCYYTWMFEFHCVKSCRCRVEPQQRLFLHSCVAGTFPLRLSLFWSLTDWNLASHNV